MTYYSHSKSQQDIVADIQTTLAELETKTRIVQRMLSVPMAEWDSVENVSVNLKRQLALAAYWTDIRPLVVQLSEEQCGLISEGVDRKNCCDDHNRIDVSTYGTGWNRGSYGASEAKCKQLFGRVPKLESFRIVVQTCNTVDAVVADIDILWQQSHELLTDRPKYMELKRLLPVGGRRALSALLVVATGKMHRNNTSQNELFGLSDDVKQIGELCRYTLHNLDPRHREKKGKAPSFAAGCDLRYKAEYSRSNRKPWREATPLVDQLRRWHCHGSMKGFDIDSGFNLDSFRMGQHDGFPDHYYRGPSMSPIMYTASHEYAKQAKRSVKILRKVMGIHEGSYLQGNVPTVLTGRVESIGGDDYRCPALWRVDGELIRGYVYCRRNWNDMFHGPDMSADNAHAQLDQSSQYYFDRERQLEERRLSSRQRQARMLIRVRRIDSFTLRDSYVAGNCVAGTNEFVRQLGLAGESVNGRSMAMAWRTANYPQYERFSACVSSIENSAHVVDN